MSLVAQEMSHLGSRIHQTKRGFERVPSFKGPVPLDRFLAVRGGIKEDRGESSAMLLMRAER